MIASLDGKQFVKTNSFNEAYEKLHQKRIVVLKGNPGEGKTTMSRMLAREVGNGKCVNLSTPSDWRNVNVTEHIVIIIDDIFGASVLDVNEFRRWHKVLTEIETAVQTKGNKLHIIVTSRNYILNEALQRMYCPTFFTDENTVKLSSEQLSYSEKKDILECHLNMEGRECSKEFVQKCVQCRKESAAESQSFPIGFPECARLFCQRKDLYQKGHKFFQQPLHFIKEHIRTVFGEDELTFLAYFLVWAQENQELSIQDIELPIHVTPDSVISVIKSLQFSPEHCLRKIGQCLIEHRDGFLNFDNNTGMYQFSHKVIADVVGLIAFERNTTAALTSCDFDFAMRYIRTEQTQQDTLYVSPYRFSRLSVKLVEFMTIEANQIDGSVIQHEAFRNKTFCNTFCETPSIQLDSILVVHVQSLSTVFMQYDIELQYDKSRLASFSLFKGNGKSVFAELCFGKSIIPKEVLEEELYLSTMIAIRFGVIDTLVWLSEHGTKVTDEMIILAAKEEKHDVIQFLQRKCDKNEADVSLGWNKKSKQNPVLWMVQNGASIAVSLLLSRHNDFKYVKIKNKSCTALHVACHFGSAEIAGIILDNYSYLDHENEHGYHPIHIAAKKGHTETVMALLEKKKEAQICKTLTLPKKDSIKGLTLLHVAIWVDNDELAEKLVKTGFFARKLDALQRTPLVFALNGRKHRCIKQLLQMDEIDKETPDLDGNTPLHIAILKANHESSYVEYAKALCDKVDVNIQNKDGDTALHFAYATKESEIRNKLLENPNVKRNIKNKQDRIPSQVLQLSTDEEYEQDVNEDDV
ncbi:uncharacterized protein LOC128550463 [Mercenaria mercenaria]|uniref:uncharacterized protein LOC128550463 n=1 Tax=Mercenaria mercenaria TaxID=6596 RepID=UPI00234FAD71|nr:uncharacterized protein LOC128550463 [Mercenaria mercenaria]